VLADHDAERSPPWLQFFARSGTVPVQAPHAFAAPGGFLRAAREVKESGTFTFAHEAVPFAEVNELMAAS
jgi:hypothetical protein